MVEGGIEYCLDAHPYNNVQKLKITDNYVSQDGINNIGQLV